MVVGDATHAAPVGVIMERWCAGCKVVAPVSGPIILVSTNRFRLLRSSEDARDAQLSRTEEQLRATARQQEAVAHLGQQALAGAPVGELVQATVALAARVLEVEFRSEERRVGK